MKRLLLNEFESKVLNDIKKNHGRNLQDIYEDHFEDGDVYEKSWEIRYVFYPICIKLLNTQEVSNLMLEMIDAQEYKKDLYDVFFTQLRMIPVYRLSEV